MLSSYLVLIYFRLEQGGHCYRFKRGRVWSYLLKISWIGKLIN